MGECGAEKTLVMLQSVLFDRADMTSGEISEGIGAPATVGPMATEDGAASARGAWRKGAVDVVSLLLELQPVRCDGLEGVSFTTARFESSSWRSRSATDRALGAGAMNARSTRPPRRAATAAATVVHLALALRDTP